MISYQYTISNKVGKSIKFNDHTIANKVFALQKYPNFSRVVKNTEMEKEGQNGFWDFKSYFGKETVTFTGVIIAPDHKTLENMKVELLQVFNLPQQPTELNDGYVTVDWIDDNNISKQFEAKIVNDIQFDRPIRRREVLDFIIQLKLKKNYITDQTVNSVTGNRAYFLPGGLLFPVKLPQSWNPDYANKLILNITGTQALPVIRLLGEAQQAIKNPTITNLTTGAVCKINTTIFGNKNYIEIDSETGTAKDQSGQDMSAYFSSDSTLIELISGNNELIYTSDEDPLVSLIEPEKNNFLVSYKNQYAN